LLGLTAPRPTAPELLWQPDEAAGQLPRPGAGHAGRTGAARKHPDRSDLRPWRDGAGSRRPAPEDVQFLRRDAAGADDLLESEAFSRTCRLARDGFARRLSADDREPFRYSAARAGWQGIDYSGLLLDPAGEAPQRYIAFTNDDYQFSQICNVYPGPNNHVVSIREERYKLAKYFSVEHPDIPCEWEMYDLANDPLETRNLGYRGYQRTPEEEAHFARLQRDLAMVERTRLKPLPAAAAA